MTGSSATSPEPTELTDSETERYARHLILDEIGDDGQQTLKAATVTVVGTGGIGAPALQYLASSGVGCLRIIDDDAVDLSNLQRQVIHRNDAVGRLKTDSAADSLKALNPEVRSDLRPVRLTAENAGELLKDSSVILDGSDSYDTRCLVSETARDLAVPLISASVSGFDGQLMVLRGHLPGHKTYRDVFPDAPQGRVSCADVGVFAPLAGMMGCLAAGEVIKLLCGLDTLNEQLLLLDGRTLRQMIVRF